MNPDIRWKRRFEDFQRAYLRLREALVDGPGALNLLEREGTVRRFRCSFELGWKMLKDYLEESGIVLSPVTPRQVLKEGFAAKILADGQVWIDMLDHRNLLSHTYDSANFERAVEAIAARYLPAMGVLHEFLQEGNRK